MGSLLAKLPMRGPLWFSYYGPIRHPEASEALNAEITAHLQEIGAAKVPIRDYNTERIVVHVGLNNPAMTFENGKTTVHWSASAPGKLSVMFGEIVEVFEFRVSLDLEFTFPRNNATETGLLKFEFDVASGVSARIFEVEMHGESQPVIVDDRIISSGVEFAVSRVYTGEEYGNVDSDGFSDGLCLVCCVDPVSVIVFPCRHCCMCKECSKLFAAKSNKCPVCRETVLELVNCQTSDHLNG